MFQRKIKGFTLLELIISSVIFSLLAVGLGATFSAGLKSWNMVEKYSSESSIFLSLETLARELRQAIYDEEVVFKGQETEITFCSVKDNTLLELHYIFDEEKKSLMKKTRALKDVYEGKEDDEKSTEILSLLEKVQIEYLFLNADNKTQWLSSWEEKEFLPCALRVVISKNKRDFFKTIFIPVCGN